MPVRPKRTVLLIDDSAEDRATARNLLMSRRPDYTLLEATTGGEGLEVARSKRPDCIIASSDLPDLTGTELLDALEETDDGPRVPYPVIMMSGEESEGSASAALGRGAQDYLEKGSLTAPALVRAVENAIEKFSIYRQLEEERRTVEQRNRKLETLRTELQDKLAELSEAQKAKDRFLAVMSHEMRTPLNAILGYSDLLDMGVDGELTAGQRAQLDRIRVGGRHLLDLINDVLDLARADARKLEMDMRAVEVQAVLEEVAGLLDSQAAEKGIRLDLKGCTDLPLVQADLRRLRQILTNLVGNAIKFTEKGSVNVRCGRGGDGMVRVDVIDTGIGIAPDVLPMVFQEFYQVDAEFTREKGGSGLGLAISQRLARLMGGELQGTSEPGKGSTFTLLLQEAAAGSAVRAEDVQRHTERMEVRPEAARAGGPAVVVAAFADSEKALRELERQVQPTVRLVWTTDPDALPELAVREKVTLVVLDISSLRGAAWKAAQAIQEVPELSGTALLLLPAIPPATSDDAPPGIDLGWMTLVPKPFSPEQLTRAVTRAARGLGEEDREEDDAEMVALVVDDDVDSRRVATKILTEAGVAVREAQDGETALMEMRQHLPDVVVLDLMMPVLDGFGVLAAMRTDPELARIPVVVLTAKTLTEAERGFLARTAARVLHKGEHRLADVAALVLRAAARAPQRGPLTAETIGP